MRKYWCTLSWFSTAIFCDSISKLSNDLSIAATKKHQHITCRAGSWDSHSLRLPWLRKCYLACVCREGVGSSWERRLSMSLLYLISYRFQFNSSIQKHRVHWELFSRTGPTHLDFSCLLFLRLDIVPHVLRAEFSTAPTVTRPFTCWQSIEPYNPRDTRHGCASLLCFRGARWPSSLQYEDLGWLVSFHCWIVVHAFRTIYPYRDLRTLGISTEAPVMTVELSKLRNTVGAPLSFYR